MASHKARIVETSSREPFSHESQIAAHGKCAAPICCLLHEREDAGILQTDLMQPCPLRRLGEVGASSSANGRLGLGQRHSASV